MPKNIQKILKQNTSRARKMGRVFSGHLIGKTGLDERPEAYAGPDKEYCKFVVLTHARTGSSTMITTLNMHPAILTFGEIFRGDQISYNNEGFDNQSKKLMALRQAYPVEFLKRQIFAGYPQSIRAVGFKLFPEHIANHYFRPAWDWLVANKSVRIIVLSRENLLAYYSSKLIAAKTKVFGIRNAKDRTNTTINIDFNECLEKFESRIATQRRILDSFKDHKLLEISYEEMTRDMNLGFSKLQEFIGVDVQPLIACGVKKEVRPLSTVIENYPELKRRFSKTKWQYLFTE